MKAEAYSIGWFAGFREKWVVGAKIEHYGELGSGLGRIGCCRVELGVVGIGAGLGLHIVSRVQVWVESIKVGFGLGAIERKCE
jgi:hypothetical protein